MVTLGCISSKHKLEYKKLKKVGVIIISIEVRMEEFKDYDRTREVIYSAFYHKDKDVNFNEWVFMDKLRKGMNFIPELSYVAEVGNKVCGHIVYTPMTIINKEVEYKTLALGPISVHRDYQNQGVGTKLIEVSMKRIIDYGYKAVLVMGDPNYYKRFGFKLASKYNIGIDSNFDNDYIFVKELALGELSKISGIIKYCDEFYHNGELL